MNIILKFLSLIEDFLCYLLLMKHLKQGCSNGGEEVTRESVRGDVPQIEAKYREIAN